MWYPQLPNGVAQAGYMQNNNMYYPAQYPGYSNFRGYYPNPAAWPNTAVPNYWYGYGR